MQKKNIIQKVISMFYGQMDARQLKRKLATFAGISIVIIILCLMIGKTDIMFCIATGLLSGLVLYIPIRIKEYFGVGWIMAIIITVVYIGLAGTLFLKKGFEWLAVLFYLIPVIDIGLSIYAVIINKNND